MFYVLPTKCNTCVKTFNFFQLNAQINIHGDTHRSEADSTASDFAIHLAKNREIMSVKIDRIILS